MCRPLKSFNVNQLSTVTEVLRAIDQELTDLRSIAAETDFSDPTHAAQFSRNVLYLKTYYERAEALLREQAV